MNNTSTTNSTTTNNHTDIINNINNTTDIINNNNYGATTVTISSQGNNPDTHATNVDTDRLSSNPVPPPTVEKMKKSFAASAIGGELDVRKRVSIDSVNPTLKIVSTGLVMYRSFYRLVPALTTLILCYNCLTSIRGLEHLNALEFLDISHNAISDYASLSPLIHMTKLRLLALEGNPLTANRNYRSEVATKYFGPRETTIDGYKPTVSA
eukprot:m.170472 g.170472  ORF g.170472 m.170472 type:complete len:210 (-) comp31611_c1_seq4:118-747(-)